MPPCTRGAKRARQAAGGSGWAWRGGRTSRRPSSWSMRMTRVAPRTNAHLAASRPTASKGQQGAAGCAGGGAGHRIAHGPNSGMPIEAGRWDQATTATGGRPDAGAGLPARRLGECGSGGRRGHAVASPGPAPQMATRSPCPTSPSSQACQAVGRMSERSTTLSSGRPGGTLRQFVLAGSKAGGGRPRRASFKPSPVGKLRCCCATVHNASRA